MLSALANCRIVLTVIRRGGSWGATAGGDVCCSCVQHSRAKPPGTQAIRGLRCDMSTARSELVRLHPRHVHPSPNASGSTSSRTDTVALEALEGMEIPVMTT